MDSSCSPFDKLDDWTVRLICAQLEEEDGIAARISLRNFRATCSRMRRIIARDISRINVIYLITNLVRQDHASDLQRVIDDISSIGDSLDRRAIARARLRANLRSHRDIILESIKASRTSDCACILRDFAWPNDLYELLSRYHGSRNLDFELHEIFETVTRSMKGLSTRWDMDNFVKFVCPILTDDGRELARICRFSPSLINSEIYSAWKTRLDKAEFEARRRMQLVRCVSCIASRALINAYDTMNDTRKERSIVQRVLYGENCTSLRACYTLETCLRILRAESIDEFIRYVFATENEPKNNRARSHFHLFFLEMLFGIGSPRVAQNDEERELLRKSWSEDYDRDMVIALSETCVLVIIAMMNMDVREFEQWVRKWGVNLLINERQIERICSHLTMNSQFHSPFICAQPMTMLRILVRAKPYLNVSRIIVRFHDITCDLARQMIRDGFHVVQFVKVRCKGHYM